MKTILMSLLVLATALNTFIAVALWGQRDCRKQDEVMTSLRVREMHRLIIGEEQ